MNEALTRRLFAAGGPAALNGEGIPARGGYSPLNANPFLKRGLESRIYLGLCSRERLAQWPARNRWPAKDQLCGQAVMFSHQCLLGPRTGMEKIAQAVKKVQSHTSEIAKA